MNAIILGLIGGILYGFSGFLKSGEAFEMSKFLKTLILAVFVGVANALSGLPLTGDAIMIAVSAGEVAVLENFLKALMKYYKKMSQ